MRLSPDVIFAGPTNVVLPFEHVFQSLAREPNSGGDIFRRAASYVRPIGRLAPVAGGVIPGDVVLEAPSNRVRGRGRDHRLS